MRDRFSGAVSTAMDLDEKEVVVFSLGDIFGIPVPGQLIDLPGRAHEIVDIAHETRACLSGEVLPGGGQACVAPKGGRDLRRPLPDIRGQRHFGGPA